MQPLNTATLCSAITATATQICPALLPRAQIVQDTFSEAFSLFGKCHTVYNGNALTDSAIVKL